MSRRACLHLRGNTVLCDDDAFAYLVPALSCITVAGLVVGRVVAVVATSRRRWRIVIVAHARGFGVVWKGVWVVGLIAGRVRGEVWVALGVLCAI